MPRKSTDDVMSSFMVRWPKADADLEKRFANLVETYCVDKSKLSRELLRAWVEYAERHKTPIQFPVKITIEPKGE